MAARGRYILMVDADGATQFSDLKRLQSEASRIESKGFSVAVGSRSHLQSDAVATRSFVRTILMYGFHFLVQSLCVRGISDTQCGFKLFSRAAARLLFPNLHVERWAFDVELLFMARRLGIPLVEVPVNWKEVDGSHLNPALASLQMARDLFRIRVMYILGIWSLHRNTKEHYEKAVADAAVKGK